MFEFIVVYTTVLHGKISIQLEIPLATARRSCPSTTTRVAHSGCRMRFGFCVAYWVAGKSLAFFFSSSSNMFNANIFQLCVNCCTKPLQPLHEFARAIGVWGLKPSTKFQECSGVPFRSVSSRLAMAPNDMHPSQVQKFWVSFISCMC